MPNYCRFFSKSIVFGLLSSGCQSRNFAEIKDSQIQVNLIKAPCRVSGQDLAGPVKIEGDSKEVSKVGISSKEFTERAKNLTSCFLSENLIKARVEDLKIQLIKKQTRNWKLTEDYEKSRISDTQILSGKSDVNEHQYFLEQFKQAIILSAEVEAPVTSRVPGYGGESFYYMYPMFPAIAEFTGGKRQYNPLTQFHDLVGTGGKGNWEQEEFGHGNHFRDLYKLLKGPELDYKPGIVCNLSWVSACGEKVTPDLRVRRHFAARVASEISATTAYIWLMSHSTADLQQAISQPFEDEIGHLAKFYAIYRWAYGRPDWISMADILKENFKLVGAQKEERTTGADLSRTSLAVKQEFLSIAKEVYESMARFDKKYFSDAYLSSIFDESTDNQTKQLMKMNKKQVAGAFTKAVKVAETRTRALLTSEKQESNQVEVASGEIVSNVAFIREELLKELGIK